MRRSFRVPDSPHRERKREESERTGERFDKPLEYGGQSDVDRGTFFAVDLALPSGVARLDLLSLARKCLYGGYCSSGSTESNPEAVRKLRLRDSAAPLEESNLCVGRGVSHQSESHRLIGRARLFLFRSPALARLEAQFPLTSQPHLHPLRKLRDRSKWSMTADT